MPAANGHAAYSQGLACQWIIRLVYKAPINQDGSQNLPKIQRVGSQNPSCWGPKSLKISLGRGLGASWRVSGPSWAQDGSKSAKRPPKADSWTPPGPPKLEAKINKIRSWSHASRNHFFDCFLDRYQVPFGTHLAPSWHPKLSQNRSKLGSKMHPKSKQPKSQKLQKTCRFFNVFVIWPVCSWDAFWNLTWLYFGTALGGKLDLKS